MYYNGRVPVGVLDLVPLSVPDMVLVYYSGNRAVGDISKQAVLCVRWGACLRQWIACLFYRNGHDVVDDMMKGDTVYLTSVSMLNQVPV